MFAHAINALEFCERLGDLIDDHAAWSQRTFGTDAERGPVGPLRHLEKEAAEARLAWEINTHPDGSGFIRRQNETLNELADSFLLLLDATRRSGCRFTDLLAAAQKKHQINKTRQWETPAGPDEPIEHVR